jgi:acetylornithine/succinyldiaminopimelate/putrescine aminotransferase
MLLRSCSHETLKNHQQLDLLLEANIEHKHAKQQIRTTKSNTPNKIGLKREQGLVLGTQTQDTLRTKLLLKRFIYREICIITHKDYMLDIF